MTHINDVKRALRERGLSEEEANIAVNDRKPIIEEDIHYGQSASEIADCIWAELVNPF